MREPFKGTDTYELQLDADCGKLIGSLLEQAVFSGNVLEVSDSLDEYFDSFTAGKQMLSHDQLSLLLELFGKATFTKAARPVASKAKTLILKAHATFYEES